MAALVKLPDDPHDLGNQIGVRCPMCDKPFILTYPDTEWNKLNEWRRLAAMALRESHKTRHEKFPIELVWKVRLNR